MAENDAPNLRIIPTCLNCKLSYFNYYRELWCDRFDFQTHSTAVCDDYEEGRY
jgi:hypothetical protein